MAQKLLKAGGKRKSAAKRPAKKIEDGSVVLVGTYREKQFDWIKKNGVYNYPLTVPSASSRTGADKTDYSNPCKHAAAALLILGEEIARRPMTLLELRGISMEDLCDED